MDEYQRKVFAESVTDMVGGLHLVQGPPGTSKSSTAVVAIPALTTPRYRVMFAGGSNTSVYNLPEAIARTQSPNFVSQVSPAR